MPLLGGDDEVLRPLWAGLVDGADWAERVTKVRGELGAASSGGGDSDGDSSGRGPGVNSGGGDEVVGLARRMLDSIPEERSVEGLREWAEVCSVAALRIHQLLDPLDKGDADAVTACREGRTEGVSHLVGSELRRQLVVLELFAAHGATGVRKALDVSTEGRRVLRAVVSRRARGARRG
ncbi:hypothetical protein STRIP9103_06210 [Streptomyces ipomoeae 91-03]|uniref:Uncharacterized protein n=1 Tax=Streptomyces ipomoeae 91-03 TaxID=698759 RepID=L1L6E5_9ACTN|nr:hypothetical protein STRIP9103_06210 [Streptomyces ipomoeae 91-03]